jgi:hypothetical protein
MSGWKSDWNEKTVADEDKCNGFRFSPILFVWKSAVRVMYVSCSILKFENDREMIILTCYNIERPCKKERERGNHPLLNSPSLIHEYQLEVFPISHLEEFSSAQDHHDA